MDVGTVSSKGLSKIDTNYIVSFSDYVTSRAYFSRKFTSLGIEDRIDGSALDYQPNTTLNFGIGATINGFTLNLAYGFGFLNPDEGRGKTRYLDLQSHIYTRKVVIDFFGQFYKGQYLENTSFFNSEFSKPFYLRPDIGIVVIGISAFKVKNSAKFSYAAPYVQNEYQKKSSGSLLYGGKFFLASVSGDSSFIPSFTDTNLFKGVRDITQMGTFQIGPGIGYAHTFVMWKHFFLNLSLDFGLLLSYYSEQADAIPNGDVWQISPTYTSRFSMGYNSYTWYLGVMAVNEGITNKSLTETEDIGFEMGNIRLNYVYRFRKSKKLNEFLNKLPLI